MLGTIFEIQHFSIHDGPGIRTAVFLKGCQLQCLWCHNPESIHPHSELSFTERLCISCGNCFDLCPHGVHQTIDSQHRLDRNKCQTCGLCEKHCIGNALKISGKQVSAKQVIDEVAKDMVFYKESGGGMTLTGGEPMVQRAFAGELAKLAKERGIHVALETNLAYPYAWLCDIKEYVDLFLVDWKETYPARHKEYTGVSNEQIYHNIRCLDREGFKMRLRCPIIPGYNDRDAHFKKIAEITNLYPNIEGAELLPYHDLGAGKIKKFGLENVRPYISPRALSQKDLDTYIAQCKQFGGRVIDTTGGVSR